MSQWGTLEERFWHNVDASGGLDACWPWRGYRDNQGYGNIFGGRRVIKAHRLSLQYAGTDVPMGSFVLHSCDNPPCVNPAHLRIGTPSDNLRDMFARDRQPLHLRPWKVCKRGHPVEGANAVCRGGRIRCRTCAQVRDRKRYARPHVSGEPHPTAAVAPDRSAAGVWGSPDPRERVQSGPGDLTP